MMDFGLLDVVRDHFVDSGSSVWSFLYWVVVISLLLNMLNLHFEVILQLRRGGWRRLQLDPDSYNWLMVSQLTCCRNIKSRSHSLENEDAQRVMLNVEVSIHIEFGMLDHVRKLTKRVAAGLFTNLNLVRSSSLWHEQLISLLISQFSFHDVYWYGVKTEYFERSRGMRHFGLRLVQGVHISVDSIRR